MIYIANDVEAAGPKLCVHPILSMGAAVITRESISFSEYWEKGLVFYAEFKPDSFAYDESAMRVGCSNLECLEEVKRRDPRYDTENKESFSPMAVLDLMFDRCEHPSEAVKRFKSWLDNVKGQHSIVGVTDTVFFDGGRIELLLGKYSSSTSPYGWKGLDLNSVLRGYLKKEWASLDDLVPDEREKPHKADQDAVYLAQIGRVLLFEKMGCFLPAI